jgi:dephospho-CoA kinase
MFVVGLTGGIGSGKSTVGSLFNQLGVTVIDADRVSRKVVEPDTQAVADIAQHFGKECLQQDGSLNRAHLRSLVFENKQNRQWLEALLHPLIREDIIQQLASASGPYVILESPLLLETNQHELTDRVLVVDIPESLQLERASKRDHNSRKQIQAIMDSQLPRHQRVERADDIIENTQPIPSLRVKVAKLHQDYLQLAENE